MLMKNQSSKNLIGLPSNCNIVENKDEVITNDDEFFMDGECSADELNDA